MAKATTQSRISYVDLPTKHAVRSFIIGAGAGLASWALSKALFAFVFNPILCGSGALNVNRCASAGVYADAIAMIAIAVLGVYLFVRFAIYRPLVVVAGATVALWPVLALTSNQSIIASLIISGLLFGLGYLAFTWVVRMRPIALSLAIAIVVVVATRFALGA